jgi:short-subunit dehydrogenase
MTDDRKTALITGASSGVGSELARIHAAAGGDLVLVARRQDRLEALRTEISNLRSQISSPTVHVIVKDLSDPNAPQQLYDEVKARNIRVDYLINNAGFGYRGLFHQQDWSRNAEMIQVNVVALAAMTRLFVPDMIARGSGRVLNVASLAGFVAGPLHAVYFATKAFVLSFSEAIANELHGTGVTVTALCPGPTRTEFTGYADMEGVPGFKRAAPARKVAQAGYDAMLKGKTLVVPGLLNKLTAHVALRLAPRNLATRMSRATMEKR